MRHVICFALGAMLVGSASVRADIALTSRGDFLNVNGTVVRFDPNTNALGTQDNIFHQSQVFNPLTVASGPESLSSSGSISDTATGTQLVGGATGMLDVQSSLTFDSSATLDSYAVSGDVTSSLTSGVLENYHPEDTANAAVRLSTSLHNVSFIQIMVSTPIQYEINITQSKDTNLDNTDIGGNTLIAEIDLLDNTNTAIQPPVQIFGVTGNGSAARSGTLAPSAQPYFITFAEEQNPMIHSDNQSLNVSADFSGLFSILPEPTSFSALLMVGIVLSRTFGRRTLNKIAGE